jgi:hypothetical protein
MVRQGWVAAIAELINATPNIDRNNTAANKGKSKFCHCCLVVIIRFSS